MKEYESTEEYVQRERDMTGGDTLPQSRLEVPERVDEQAFFTLPEGTQTLAGHADLEAAVPNEEKADLQELERYWVNKPFAFVVIYRNVVQQEDRYYLVEPSLSDTERALRAFLADKLKLSIDYDAVATDSSPTDRAAVVRDEAVRLMQRYNLLSSEFASQRGGVGGRVKGWLISALRRRVERQARDDDTVDPVPVDRDPDTGERQSLSDDQVETLLYYLVRDFIRYDRIDGLKHDVNIEDISCDGYNEPVFVHHTGYGQLLTNVTFGEDELDEFVIELAQRARKGISKRQPSVDATLEDGSRAQLTLGREVSDRGTNFTIRQFKEVPFTPVDLVAWETYSLSQMVYLWLAIESNKSMVIAGGTASGKTTTLNALSLFIPSDTKLVSIEDTRELLMPQRNWVPTTTREAFRADDGSAIDEFELLEDALRKRPDYIIMGEVRGEEGRTLFQAMNTGHTVCTTFHANSPKEVIRRFTGEPIRVASSMFGAVDIIVNQTSTTVDGREVRRSTGIVEIDEYDAQVEEFIINKSYDWDSVTDEIRPTTTTTTDLMDEVRLDNGWTPEQFQREWRRREAFLAYLIREGIDTYAGVAATIQAYTHSPELTMSLVARDELADHIDELTTMRTIDIDVDDEVEELVPRPTPDEDLREEVASVLEDATDLLEEYDTGNHYSALDETWGDTRETENTRDTPHETDGTQREGDGGGFPDAWEQLDTGQHSNERDRSVGGGNGISPDSGGVARRDGVTSADRSGRNTNGTGTETDRGDESDGITRVPSPEPPTDGNDEDENGDNRR